MFDETEELIRGIYQTNEAIPLHQPLMIGKEKENALHAIDTNFVSSVGHYVDRFEGELSDYTGSKKSVAVVNGTAALQVGLRLIGVKKNDEVITQALTFVATANAIAYNNAHPIFLDVDFDTMGLSPKAVSGFLDEFGELREDGCYNKSTGRKISACMPMHTFGFPVHLDELIKVCNLWKIPIVEDAAESLGSQYKGMPAGSFGEVGAFSFNGNKIVTAGGGGAILTHDESLAKKAKHLTTTAKVPHKWKYEHDCVGYNYRMPNLNAALICAQLEGLDKFVDSKRETAKQYEAFFEDCEYANFIKEPGQGCSNYWLNAILVPDRSTRDDILSKTNQLGVMTRPMWTPMPSLPMFENCLQFEIVNARAIENQLINLPSSVVSANP